MSQSIVAPSAGSLYTIGTHNGVFHCDEAFACYLLKQLPAYRDAVIKRTRNPEELRAMTVLVDVGGIHDAAALRFDHHQRSFSETFSPNHSVTLSSAGLVYKHFGKELLPILTNNSLSSEDLDTVYVTVYEHFVQALDALDNGISQFPDGGEPRYKSSTDLVSRVNRLNPSWYETLSPSEIDQRFQKAMELTGVEFCAALDYVVKDWLCVKTLVDAAIDTRFSVHNSGCVIELERWCPYMDHVREREAALGLGETLLYVIFKEGQQWRITCLQKGQQAFVSRQPLNKDWHGLSGEKLQSVSQIPGITFVHASGFTGGNATREGVIDMADKTMNKTA